MRIALTGAHDAGKQAFIDAFIERWPMYQCPATEYRKHLDSEADLAMVDRQRHIRDDLVTCAQTMVDTPYCIHNQCVLDNLAHTLYYANDDDQWPSDQLATTFKIAQSTIKLYDLILWLPTSNIDTPTEDGNFRQSIDNILSAMFKDNETRKGNVFDPEDSPPMICLGGINVPERILLSALYVNEDGDPYAAGDVDLTVDNVDGLKQTDKATNRPQIYT